MVPPPKWWSYQWGSWQRSAFHPWDGEQDEVCSPSGCCSQTGCDHLPAAYQQRLTSAGLGECPPCLEFLPSHSQWSQMVPPPKWWSYQWGSWQRSAFHPWDGEQDEGCSPSGCYSQTGCDHLPAACQQRLTSAGLVECPPCLEFLPSHFQWNQMVPPPK